MPRATTNTVRAVAAITFAGYLTFAMTAIAVEAGMTESLDRAILLALRSSEDPADAWGPPVFEQTAAEITALGGYPILTVIAILVMCSLWLVQKRGAAVFLALALIGGSILSSGLKQLFSRIRPDLVEHMDRTFTSSFPSGHATLSMLTLLTLAAIVVRFVPHHGMRVFAILAAFLLALVIGASRVYLGVHWPSDVVAGWSLGIGWAGSCWLVAHYLSRERQGMPLGKSDT